ncbi:VirK/YbjX family protein [Moritella yayanosii]|nr:VirK/YbjX family protein [Moritella yayanosii]
MRKIQKKGRFYFWAMTNGKAVNAMATLFSSEHLKPILKNNPEILEKPLKPYLCVNWSSKERIKHLTQHYQFIDDTFGEHANAVISSNGITILAFESLSGQTYRIQLYRGSSREGGLGIRLVNGKNQSVYALSCNISGTHTKTMHIGMLQGPRDSVENRHALIKELTKSLHGLRTKSLLVEMALMLSRILGISEVKAISNKGHIYQAIRYMGSKRNSVTFDYDGLWNEFEATKIDPYMFGLSVFTPRKDPLTLKKTKRKMYTKRYQWLDDTEIEMAKNLAPWLVNPIVQNEQAA